MHRLLDNRNVLGVLFLLPAGLLLVLFLTYPLGLGTWLGFTDVKIGRAGEFVGLDNFRYLAGDAVAQLSLFNTFFYTVVASVLKFALGLWLAVLLNEHLPFKAFLRAIVLLPFIVPTALSAIAFWWIYDAQFSVISWTLQRMGLIDTYIDFLGDPWMARFSTIAANVWRGVPYSLIMQTAGLQSISVELYDAALVDGASPMQTLRRITLPLIKEFLLLNLVLDTGLTFHVFDTIFAMTAGGPMHRTETFSINMYLRAFRFGELGMGSAIGMILLLISLLLAVVYMRFFRTGANRNA